MNATLYLRLSTSACEIGLPIRATNDAYVSWLALISEFLARRFGNVSLWFAADLDVAREWAFPEEIDAALGEHDVRIGNDTFRLAYTECVDVRCFRDFVESVDFKTDSVLLVPASRDAEETVLIAMRQTARLLHGETTGITVNVASSFADGFGFLWLNHSCEPADLRSEIATLAAEHGLHLRENTDSSAP